MKVLRLLLSAIGRASNHGQPMDGEKLLDIGTSAIEVEIIDAVISIRTDNEKLRVQSVNSEGFQRCVIPSEVEGERGKRCRWQGKRPERVAAVCEQRRRLTPRRSQGTATGHLAPFGL